MRLTEAAACWVKGMEKWHAAQEAVRWPEVGASVPPVAAVGAVWVIKVMSSPPPQP